jgi:N-acetylglucosamine-6-phosphate deacetylase
MSTRSLTHRMPGASRPVLTAAAGLLVGLLAGAGFARAADAVAGDPEAWRAPVPDQPAHVLVRNATVWTCGPQGILEGADVLVERGKIVRVGKGLSAPGDALVIDAQGKHVTPGLIDCHSHTAITGGVNEGTHNITAEVRVQDVVDPRDGNLYRQLAGGLTAANLLHGSANAIGGQNCVIKLRYGEDPEGLKMKGAKPGIKFALGENPKQSNWGPQNNSRYPQTRSGVEQLIRERFLAARDYMKARDAWRSGRRKGLPPRRDLQLDAIAEVLRGERLVHCHAYRADEILMLIRLADEFGFTIGTFQHVLEGYKVADEIAAHGAGASSFSDWWAYKFEVYDAIPYNGAIMWDRGVVVSFNSDNDELATRLNQEAAKAVKYGGVPEEEALKFVTLNAAKQLAVADRVGSLEPGKDADFVVWSGNPLSTYTVCEQTWVDGKKYFDREADIAGREALAAERKALIEKIRNAKKTKDAETPKEEPTASADPETAKEVH